ncbi:CgeB family protein [Prosthecomicrobium sp. N25]|uniref:CgeB family protein n=1 Tax=Prosthecomicrobium sp. N25 TaxID=3129254 RepID=UPI003076FC25
MRVLLYTHSLVSDWNHGNAHFLRGVARDLISRGHEVVALEPEGGWSRTNLEAEQGTGIADRFAEVFPELASFQYDIDFNHEAAVAEADLVLVHEWTEPSLVARLGRARRNGGTFTLLFHDTHHRAVSEEKSIADLDLSDYDAVLAFGETLSERYRKAGWGRRVFTWHEAADTRLFRPRAAARGTDVVWIGNWGDGERSAEIDAFLIEPVKRLGLSATVRGVRYPLDALERLAAARIDFGGWIANADVPAVFARARSTVHIPRRPYVEALPGIPTIRVFEALACGVPLVSAPWDDAEGLFRPGTDYLVARDTNEMAKHLKAVVSDPDLARALRIAGLDTITRRHTCHHRVAELLGILAEVGTARVRAALPETVA